MIQIIRAEAIADIDAAADTAAFVMDAPRAGKLVINQCFGRWEEAAGTQTTTAGVVSLEVNDNEVGTITSAKNEAIGDADTFTVDGTNATSANPVYGFTAGQEIAVRTKTQAVGGTVTGTVRVYLALDLADVTP